MDENQEQCPADNDENAVDDGVHLFEDELVNSYEEIIIGNEDDAEVDDTEVNDAEVDDAEVNDTEVDDHGNDTESQEEQQNNASNDVDADRSESENDADDDILSIFGDDEDDTLLENELMENSQPKRQMELPKWKKALQSDKGTEIKLKPIPKLPPKPIEQTKPAVEQPNNVFKIPTAVGSRDPREAKKNLLVEKEKNQNGMASSSMPFIPMANNAQQAGQRVSVKDRLGVRSLNANMNRPNTTIPSLMSLRFSAQPLVAPIETTIGDIPNLPAFLPPVAENIPDVDLPTTSSKSMVPVIASAAVAAPPPPVKPIFILNPEIKLSLPSFFQSPEQYRPVFGYLFEKTCRPFMHDDCKFGPNQCKYEHRLPDNEWFSHMIDQMLRQDILDLYDVFILRVPKLFDTYFKDFCAYFAKNEQRHMLKQMVADCVDRHKQKFFQDIIEGYKTIGVSYTKSLAEIIPNIKHRTAATNNIVIRLILDNKNTSLKSFFTVLESIAKQPNYMFPVESANRLLRIFEEKPSKELATVIFCITNNDKIINRLDQPLLNKFMSTSALIALVNVRDNNGQTNPV